MKSFFIFLLFFNVYSLCCFGQLQQPSEGYEEYLHLRYEELDSIMTIEYNNGTLSNAIPYMQAGMEKAEKEYGTQSEAYENFVAWGGFIYEVIGDYQQAESFYLQGLAIQKAISGEQHITYAHRLGNLATLYESMGNYTQAESFFLQALAIVKTTLGENSSLYGIITHNLGGLYKTMKNYTAAEPLLTQAPQILKKTLGEKNQDYIISLGSLANLYEKMKNYQKAEVLFLEATVLEKKVFGEHHYVYSSGLNNLAVLYRSMGRYEEAEQLHLKGLSIERKNLGEEHPNYIGSLNNLAILYEKMGKLDSAYHYCRLGILANAPTMDSSFDDWGSLDTFSYSVNEYINHSIKTLLDIFFNEYNQTKDKSILERYYVVSQTAIRLNERFRKSFTIEGDKLRILAKSNAFVLASIKAGTILNKANHKEISFGFAEMNKGVLLLESAKTANAQQFGGLPDSLVYKEKDLQKKQSNLYAKLLEKRPSYEKDSLRKVLNNVGLEMDNFTKMLKSKFPKYAALKYDDKTVNARDIQAVLDDKTALIEYVIGDSVV